MMQWDFYVVMICLILGATAYISPNSVKFDQKFFAKASFLLAGFFLASFIIHDIILFDILSKYFPHITDHVTQISKKMYILIDGQELLRVWWEDVVYVLPSVVLYHTGHKKLSWAILLATMPDFVHGHMYQGILGYTSFIYLLVSRFFSIRYGLVSMMLIHVLYDGLIFLRCASIAHGYML